MSLPDFLSNGGDDFNKVIKYFNPTQEEKTYYEAVRDIVSKYV
jgi:hypothetical protein